MLTFAPFCTVWGNGMETREDNVSDVLKKVGKIPREIGYIHDGGTMPDLSTKKDDVCGVGEDRHHREQLEYSISFLHPYDSCSEAKSYFNNLMLPTCEYLAAQEGLIELFKQCETVIYSHWTDGTEVLC